MYELSIWTVLLLALAAGAAGWVDAVSGGGGLLQLPALFIALPAGSEVNALATNKLSSIFGTATAARTYIKNLTVWLLTVSNRDGVLYWRLVTKN